MSSSLAPLSHANRRTAGFYDRVAWLYPLVDLFCAAGRRRLIQRINREPAGRLLDIGVGPGHHLPHYRGHSVSAIDCSPRMIASCRRHSPQTCASVMDGERLEFPDGSFDYVALCHVLSVTARPARMLAEARRVLTPRGWIFVLNHETPANAWRHVETLLSPLAGTLCFRSRFRLADIPGVERFATRRLENPSGLGLFKAWSLQK
jgi:phosphatidylethanolamine/phosphatidyl-N-methylethanolamine N-methyltransferase